MDPAEAGRLGGIKSQEKRREKAEEAAKLDADSISTVVPIRVARIIRALEIDAAQGHAAAARELRAWLERYPPRDEEVTPDALPAVLRARLLARLIAEDDAEQGQNEAQRA